MGMLYFPYTSMQKVHLRLSDLNFIIKGSKRTCLRLTTLWTRSQTHYTTVRPRRQTPDGLEKYIIAMTMVSCPCPHLQQSTISASFFPLPLLGLSATFYTVHNILNFRAMREADVITTAANPE